MVELQKRTLNLLKKYAGLALQGVSTDNLLGDLYSAQPDYMALRERADRIKGDIDKIDSTANEWLGWSAPSDKGDIVKQVSASSLTLIASAVFDRMYPRSQDGTYMIEDELLNFFNIYLAAEGEEGLAFYTKVKRLEDELFMAGRGLERGKNESDDIWTQRVNEAYYDKIQKDCTDFNNFGGDFDAIFSLSRIADAH